jgi:CheY-like chemotaxis protein/signal transduction histidine kinase
MLGRALILPWSPPDVAGGEEGLVNVSIYPWPQFRNPILRGKYRVFCESASVPYSEIAAKTIYFITYIYRMIICISRVAIYDPVFTTMYSVLILILVTLFMAGIFYVAYLYKPKSDLKGRRRMWNIFFTFIIISFAANSLFVCLKDCDRYLIFGGECVDDLSLMYHLLILGIVGPLLAYIVSHSDYLMGAVAFGAALIAQMIVLADAYGNHRSITFKGLLYMVLSTGLCHWLVMRMEFSNMSSFLGKLQEQHVKKLQHNMFETEKEQLRSVLWNVAHDMKTPMQSFLAGLHVVNEIPLKVTNAMKSSTDSKLKRDVELILRQSNSSTNEMSASYELLTMQLNRAMDVAKLENHMEEHTPYCIAVNVKEVICNVANVVTTLQCHRTRIQMGGGLPAAQPVAYVRTVKSWLSDNLLCMVSNAVKYSPASSNISLQLSVCDYAALLSIGACNMKSRAAKEQEQDSAALFLLFEITDCGVNVLDHSKVFSKLTQVEREVGGAGLGLYALRLRVLCLGGVCGSRPRRDSELGSVFFFAVPYEPVDSNGNSSGDLNADNITTFHNINDSPHSTANCITNSNANSDVNSIDNSPRMLIPEAISANISVTMARRVSVNTPTTPYAGVTSFSSAMTVQMFSSGDHQATTATLAESDSYNSVCAPHTQKVLIVDDSLSTLKLMARAFKNSGASVVTAVDGQEALGLMKDREFVLVVMDIQMPVMGGIESMTLFREWEGQQTGQQVHQFIVAASAVSCREDALKAGADMFVDKPVDIKTLLQLYQSRVSPV